ncbi:rCG61129, partial [Rattus norvegicus]
MKSLSVSLVLLWLQLH